MSCHRVPISTKANSITQLRSRAVGTERTILSPFTKEYRVLAADSGIRLYLKGSLLFRRAPTTLVLNLGCAARDFRTLPGQAKTYFLVCLMYCSCAWQHR